MKRVFIIRHAKSVPYGYDDDFNRDLGERGKTDAGLVSKELKKLGIKPGAMISSPAIRAMKTARIFAGNIGFKKKDIREMEELYEGLDPKKFLDIIKSLPGNLETVFFFGHNPGFQFFAGNLLKHYNEEMPTCTVVGINFNVDSWEQVEEHTGEQALRLTPKMFK